MNENQPNLPGDTSAGEDIAFEALLRTAMQSRPDEMPASDLAHRAMALGRAHDAAIAAGRAIHLARQRWWLQMTGLAATLLIVAMLAGVAHRLWTRGDIAAIANSSSTDTTTTDNTDGTVSTTATDADPSSSSSSTSSTARMIAIVFVAELLVLGVVLMTLSRRAPSMPFGAEAVAGFW